MAASTPLTTLLTPPTSIRQPKATTSAAAPKICRTASVSRGTILVRATKPRRESPSSITTNEPDPGFISQEDVSYLIKLGAGSVAGAAAIKYGSIIFPEITTPNILQALIMISVPVIIAVLLLIKQSIADLI